MCGVMAITVENGHDNSSSNPVQGCFAFHIAVILLGKVCSQLFSFQL